MISIESWFSSLSLQERRGRVQPAAHDERFPRTCLSKLKLETIRFLNSKSYLNSKNYRLSYELDKLPFNLPYVKPVCYSGFKSTKASIFSSDGRAATVRQAWQPLSDHRETEDACVGRKRSKSTSIYFSFSLELSLLIPLIFRANWLQIFALMLAALSPQTSLVVRAVRVAPEAPLRESLQRCVKGKHVLHSE